METVNLDRLLVDTIYIKEQAQLPDWETAHFRWSSNRYAAGLSIRNVHTYLSSWGANMKVKKNKIPTWTLNLSPADSSGNINVCPHSTPGCRGGCVMLGGQFSTNRNRRVCIARTTFLYGETAEAIALIYWELENALVRNPNHVIGARLNAASDLRWERFAPLLFDLPIEFYDYTKHPPRSRRNRPSNYHLTYSIAEDTTDRQIHKAMEEMNCAVVLDTPKHVIPDSYMGYPTIDGDASDYRPIDQRGHIVCLSSKGHALKDTTGFVRPMP